MGVYHPTHSKIDSVLTRLVYAQAGPFGPVARLALYLLGIDIPRGVRPGAGLTLIHATTGLVVHPNTVIGDDVTIFQNVTVGRADPWLPPTAGDSRVILQDGTILCAGAVVMARQGQTVTVGRETIIGANAVVTQDTGCAEVWAGNPARKVGGRHATETADTEAAS